MSSRMRVWLPISVFLLPGLLAPGCLSDHGELAERTTGGSGGAASGGAAGISGGSGGAIAPLPDGGASLDAALDARSDASAPIPPDEPPGPRTLTLLHGVVDSPWIGFCFATVHDGKPAKVTGGLW